MQGLTTAEAEARLAQYGPNELPQATQRRFIYIFIQMLREPTFALLIAGGIIYLVLGDRVEALSLLFFALISIVISSVQESRSETVLRALKDLASPRALVIRDDKQQHIAGRDVVPDDVILIEEGNRVVADAILITANDLLMDESLLTGESIPVNKSACPPNNITDNCSLDQTHRIFAGTLVVSGNAKAIIHKTGAHTEMGNIGLMLTNIESDEPHIQLQMRRLVRDFSILGILTAILALILFGIFRRDWIEALLGAIALGMSLVPEEFLLVITVFMAMGAWRISQIRVLTRRSAAIETLGSTTVLCTDKTGTITENRMSLVVMQTLEQSWNSLSSENISAEIEKLLHASLLACPADPIDPMDLAIHQLAQHQLPNAQVIITQSLHLRTYGLRPELFVVANIIDTLEPKERYFYAKGSLEDICKLCNLSDSQVHKIKHQADLLACNGVRVLGAAYTTLDPNLKLDALPTTPEAVSFTYLGLLGFADPIRESVPDAVAECHSAGIRIIMLTGDYPITANAIAQQAGISSTSVVTGDQINGLSDDELSQLINTVNVFSRIKPSQKLRIVSALKAKGNVVAMTGDGVNDAPAIKAAHIGIAMGGRGTDVAREASDIVLLDDDFSSIVKTIRLGRRIYDNLCKAVEYIFAVHIPIAGLVLLPLLLGLPLILTPIHIAFLQMLIDPACSIVFEAEPEEENIMHRAPRIANSPLLTPTRIAWGVTQGIIVFAFLIGAFFSSQCLGASENESRTLVFILLVLTNIGLIFINRSTQKTMQKAAIFSNPALWPLLMVVSTLLSTIFLWPSAREVFHLQPLSWNTLLACVALTALSILLLLLIKYRWFFAQKD